MENNKPLLSVILPVYNGERTIAKTIDSVLSQTYDNLQILIIDDASSDGSKEIIKSYKDPRIETMFFEENKNLCLGSNIALQKARGKYLSVIGHDDIWEPTKSEKQIAILESDESIAFCSTDMNIIDENDNLLTPEWEPMLAVNSKIYEDLSQEEALLWMLTSGNHVYAPSVMIRKSCIDKVGYYRNALIQTQDYDLWLRLLNIGRVHAINEKLIRYRRFSDNRTNLSSFNVETNTRQEHEIYYSIFDNIEKMDNALFLRVFKDYIKGTPNASDNNAVLCEKACILAAMSNPYFHKMYIELVERDECREYLDKTCDFGLKKFYDYNKAPVKFDSVYFDLCNRQMEIIKKLS